MIICKHIFYLEKIRRATISLMELCPIVDSHGVGLVIQISPKKLVL
jgi:hypothetical protein